MRNSHIAFFLAAFASVLSCSSGTKKAPDPALEGLALHALQPTTILPGTLLVAEGSSFVGDAWGSPQFHWQGEFNADGEITALDFRTDVDFVDLQRLELRSSSEFLSNFASDKGTFIGEVKVVIESTVDGEEYSSNPLSVALTLEPSLQPQLSAVQDSGFFFVNDKIELSPQGLLLSSEEGQSSALLEGCFRLDGQPNCQPLPSRELAIVPDDEFSRDKGSFVFSPEVSGILSGNFEGEITLINRHASGAEFSSSSLPINLNISQSELFSIGTSEASLGQYIDIQGGGFVALADNSSTVLAFDGTYTSPGQAPVPLNLDLVPEFRTGRLLRYPLNEDDSLSEEIDLRNSQGRLQGQLRPIVQFAGTRAEGNEISIDIPIAPVKQVVFLNFTPQYLEALRAFGMRALDSSIRQRVKEVVERDFRGVNVEFRFEEPSDFSLYATVEIGGNDPNGLGLLGYDNTPGKDSGNLRLHDYIGGINATTQQDGFPGYGGVFVESLFIFSENPGEYAQSSAIADSIFDEVFDPLRPDRGGAPVRSFDLREEIPSLQNGSACPATTRPEQIACAVWVLGNLIGSTVSHEVGHSLGLANPNGSGAHYDGDLRNRLMDSGGNRPFRERAELSGEGPASFCQEAYVYLREILPTDAPSDLEERPTCL